MIDMPQMTESAIVYEIPDYEKIRKTSGKIQKDLQEVLSSIVENPKCLKSLTNEQLEQLKTTFNELVSLGVVEYSPEEKEKYLAEIQNLIDQPDKEETSFFDDFDFNNELFKCIFFPWSYLFNPENESNFLNTHNYLYHHDPTSDDLEEASFATFLKDVLDKDPIYNFLKDCYKESHKSKEYITKKDKSHCFGYCIYHFIKKCIHEVVKFCKHYKKEILYFVAFLAGALVIHNFEDAIVSFFESVYKVIDKLSEKVVKLTVFIIKHLEDFYHSIAKLKKELKKGKVHWDDVINELYSTTTQFLNDYKQLNEEYQKITSKVSLSCS